MKKVALPLCLLWSAASLGQVVPTPPKTVDRVLPDDAGLQTDTLYKRKFEEKNVEATILQGKIQDLERQSESARSMLREAGSVDVTPPLVEPRKTSLTPPSAASSLPTEPLARSLPKKTKARREALEPQPWSSAPEGLVQPATETLVYAVSQEASYDETMTVLPAGSFVKARVVSGVEANTLEPYPVLLQLEYAFTGPNKTKVDLSNCFMIAKARANLSTERVIMETDTLSCVRENGEHFKSAARGYTAGEDSTFGSTGTFISKQGQVMLAAVLASIAKNAGEAVAMAQQTTTVAAGAAGAAQTATNVTGDQTRYIAGRSVVDGAAMIAQWYLDYAKQLVPSIGIGSGQTVHVIMLDTIRVPTLSE